MRQRKSQAGYKGAAFPVPCFAMAVWCLCSLGSSPCGRGPSSASGCAGELSWSETFCQPGNSWLLQEQGWLVVALLWPLA